MKRSPLTRKMPLKRSTKPLKRTRLRRISKKRLALKAVTDPERKAYVADFTCQCCQQRKACDCHEISKAAGRAKSLEYRCSWLALCRQCHELMDDYSDWPPARQAALKLLNDPDFFDLPKLNELRGRKGTAITLADVVPWLQMAW